MISIFEVTFGHKPSTGVHSPLEKGNNPELDASEFLDAEGIQKHQSLISAFQQAVSLGRLDVNIVIITIFSFQVESRKGHMNRIKRIYCYLAKFKHATIRIRTEEPDMLGLLDQNFDWEESIHRKILEVLPDDTPSLLRKYAIAISYHNANLFHNVIASRSVTSILYVLNKTPINQCSKKQAAIETATYGAEYSSTRACVEQIIDLRTTLYYLGVPIKTKSFMFGDNCLVVNNVMTPHTKIHKKHATLSFHCAREAIVAKIIGYYFVPNKINLANILSKHQEHP